MMTTAAAREYRGRRAEESQAHQAKGPPAAGGRARGRSRSARWDAARNWGVFRSRRAVRSRGGKSRGGCLRWYDELVTPHLLRWCLRCAASHRSAAVPDIRRCGRAPSASAAPGRLGAMRRRGSVVRSHRRAGSGRYRRSSVSQPLRACGVPGLGGSRSGDPGFALARPSRTAPGPRDGLSSCDAIAMLAARDKTGAARGALPVAGSGRSDAPANFGRRKL